MSLTKEQTKYFIERLNVITNKKQLESVTPKEPKEITQARKVIKEYDHMVYTKTQTRRNNITTEKTRILDMLHFGEQSELVSALKSFEEKEFTL